MFQKLFKFIRKDLNHISSSSEYQSTSINLGNHQSSSINFNQHQSSNLVIAINQLIAIVIMLLHQTWNSIFKIANISNQVGSG